MDAHVEYLLDLLRSGAQDRAVLAQRMALSDRKTRRVIERARRHGELVITRPVGRMRLYAIADSRSEYEAWRRHELMSRMGTFGEQLRHMDATADRTWPAEQMRIAI